MAGVSRRSQDKEPNVLTLKYRQDQALKDGIKELDWIIQEATKIRDHAKEHLKPEHSKYGYHGHHSTVHLVGASGKAAANLTEAIAYGRLIDDAE